MVTLIANLSTGKGTWGHVGRLIADGNFEKVLLITNEFGKEKFNNDSNSEMLIIDSRKPLLELITDITTYLKENIKDTEVALNLVSGSGKEHMAILSAIIKAGLGFRLYSLTTDGIKEI